MNKSEFNQYVRQALVKHWRNSNIEDADCVINVFTEALTEALAENTDVFLTGFGRFKKTMVEARIGRNPRTGDSIKISPYYQLKFKPGIRLKEACNRKKKPKK